jgi:hypothetical protein
LGEIQLCGLGGELDGPLLILLLPIHANSTPFSFQEITSYLFSAFQGISSPSR